MNFSNQAKLVLENGGSCWAKSLGGDILCSECFATSMNGGTIIMCFTDRVMNMAKKYLEESDFGDKFKSIWQKEETTEN